MILDNYDATALSHVPSSRAPDFFDDQMDLMGIVHFGGSIVEGGVVGFVNRQKGAALNSPDRPLALIIDDEPANCLYAMQILVAAGWRAEAAADGMSGLEKLATTVPTVVLLDLNMEDMDGLTTLRAIRSTASPAMDMAVIAYTASRSSAPDALLAEGFDGVLRKPCTPDELLAAVERWRPAPAMAGVERLIGLFGAEEIAPLLERLREQLQQALSEPERAEAESLAHRIAGSAGMLGFPTLSALWLARSNGDESVVEALRIESRRVIAALSGQRDSGADR